MEPIKIVLSGTLACDLMRSLTVEERSKIKLQNIGDKIHLTLSSDFHWVPVRQASPSLYRHAFLASEAKGPKRVHLTYEGQKIIEVEVLKKPKLQS